jgi:hypothetical protein
MSGVKQKVSKLLRRHLNGESDGKEDVENPLWGTWSRNGGGEYYESWGIPVQLKYPTTAQGTQESVITEF